MFGVLLDVLGVLAMWVETRKVKTYLDEATCDSILRGLNTILSSQQRGIKERELLQTTFHQYCIEGPSQEKYWNEESFKSHVRSTHSDATISDSELQLLWRCFHFYAHHPFPRDPQNGQVDFDAFQRAILFTVFQCDELMGTRELEWPWRHDFEFFRKANFERMFRSTGVVPEPSKEQQDVMNSSLSDAMDVLIVVVPASMHAAPSPGQLETVARKLFAEGSSLTEREVRREDISTLVNLLLRMRLKREKWASFYHIGEFAEASSGDDELTEALVTSLAGDETEEIVTSELLRAIDIMPNLQLRFYQLWAVLFQPPTPSAETKLSPAPEPEAAPTHVNGAMSLFAPQFKIEYRYLSRTVKQDARLALEIARVSPDAHDMAMARLVQALSGHSSAYIVLFTSDAVAITPKTVMGAYFPGPLDLAMTGTEDGKYQSQDNTSHLLFQLQPNFCLLRSGKSDVSITDLIKTEGKGVAAEVEAKELPDPSKVPYCIGAGPTQSGGLRVDPEKKTATLASGKWYTDLRTDESRKLDEQWEVKIQNPRMEIFMVTGGDAISALSAIESHRRAADDPRYAPYTLESKVTGEELLKRIHGFGPS